MTLYCNAYLYFLIFYDEYEYLAMSWNFFFFLMENNYMHRYKAVTSSLEVHRTVCTPGSIRRVVCDSNKPHSNSAWQQRRKKQWECCNTVFFPAFINTNIY